MANRLDDYPSITGFQSGTARIERPFLEYPTPDKYARVIERDWAVLPANFAPSLQNRTSYTNLLTYSEQFDNAAWTATNVTVSANAIANPGDGAVTADSIIETVTNAEHRVSQAYTFTAVPHAVSIFVKANSRSYIRIRANDGSTDFTAFFNLSTGAVGTVGAGVTASILALEDSWYRCRITFTPAAAAGNVYFNISTDGSTISYAGDTSKGVYLFGAQVERASTAGPYISTTSTSRTISAPDVDPGDSVNPADPFAYLVEETTPLNIDQIARGKYIRRWARVPASQVTYSSRSITKPTIPNQASSTIDFATFISSAALATAVQNSTGYWLSDYRVFAPYKAPTLLTSTLATGGTFTLTYKTSTTGAIAYNANNATINAALNGLASVISDGLTFSVSTDLSVSLGVLQMTITVGTTTTAVTMNIGSLTQSGGTANKKAFSVVVSSTQQYVSLAWTAAIASHGFSSSVALACIGTSARVADVGYWSVYDANTLQVALPSTSGIPVSLSSFSTYFGPFLRNYTQGAAQASVRITEIFYLPGVTSGISSATDIPVSQTVISDTAMIAAILAGGGYQAIDFTGPDQWRGPIYRTRKSEVNLDGI